MANAQKIFLQMHEQNKHTPPEEEYAFQIPPDEKRVYGEELAA
jgi:hypothetical protein